MIGVILCGGQSSRMGTDKGLMKNESVTWSQSAFDKLTTLQIPVKFSVNNTQYPLYAERFPVSSLITDNESLQVKGPLLGVLSTHLYYPGEDIFVLACDMVLMDTTALRQLLDIYLTNQEAGAFIFTNDGNPEPLCGIYKSRSLAGIVSIYQSHKLLKHSMKSVLDQLNTCSTALTNDQKKFFRNFNARTELNDL